ncbi:flagellar biosynthesis anti-sigma factor FlgM [Halalkalibacter alkaliphilus]|uniref:Negative regulator of flagellin synthesis n=1 Tax=Halalkalibacter alkaliphilus TaxID=2917993 RepID=A0A9X2CPY2_9BACI|nr:flagellar biosynthesis anti-sigma factor FlgM [Halalkalibacter alkaliphilus]MCL7746742.1 flagellar biosynthesis anti-sigma factor FlgM [Halalkalibacter alkaliphilus]
MKINPYNSIHQNPYRKQIEKNDKAAGVSAKRDKLEISSEALQMQKGTKIEQERAEKVKALKQKIDAGEYKVDAKAVANKFYEYWNQ